MKRSPKPFGADAEPAQPPDGASEVPAADIFALERDALAASLHGRTGTIVDDAPNDEASASDIRGTRP